MDPSRRACHPRITPPAISRGTQLLAEGEIGGLWGPTARAIRPMVLGLAAGGDMVGTIDRCASVGRGAKGGPPGCRGAADGGETFVDAVDEGRSEDMSRR